MKSLCLIEGCEAPTVGRGWCNKHWRRWRAYGDPLKFKFEKSANGVISQWMADHKNYNGDGCLIWPFGRYPDGRAKTKKTTGGRAMCEVVHGPAPSAGHEAAHSCGNGYGGCVHPNHLRWATHVENEKDKIKHGTRGPGVRHNSAKLTADQVAVIRATKGKMTAKQAAATFGVTEFHIYHLRRGRSWNG